MTLDHDTERLTPREQEVLALASRGLSNDEIAAELDLSHNAVRFHLKRVHAKLDTGGDRSILARFRGWLSGAAFLGMAKSGVAPVVAVGVATAGLAGAAVAFYPGGSDGAAAAPTLDADGRYPNGCPAVRNPQPGLETLADFARSYQLALDELRALNPGLPDGPLPADAEIHLPYQPDSGCGEAQATPAGSVPSRGGTPTGSDVEAPGAHAEAQLTPAGTAPSPGGTPAGTDVATELGFAFEVTSSGASALASPDGSRGICFGVYWSGAVADPSSVETPGAGGPPTSVDLEGTNGADLRPFKLVVDGVDRRSELTWFVAPDHEHAEACLATEAIAVGQHEAAVLFEDLASGAERELSRWSFEVVP